MEDSIKSLDILDYIQQENIDISTKAYHFMQNCGPFTVERFLSLSSYEISNMRGVGHKTSKELVSLQKYICLINGANKKAPKQDETFNGKTKKNEIVEYFKSRDFLLSISDKRLLDIFKRYSLEEFSHLSFEDIEEATNNNEDKTKRAIFFRDCILLSNKSKDKNSLDNEEYLSSNLLDYLDSNSIPLSVRARNVLKASNFKDVKEFLNLTYEGFRTIKNSGKKTAIELVNIQAIIKNSGVSYKRVSSFEKTKQDILSHEELQKLNDPVLISYTFSVRATNCLKNANIVSIRDFLKLNEEEMLKIKSLGKGTKDELLQIQRAIVQSITSEIEKFPSSWAEKVELNLEAITEYYWRGDIVLSDLTTDVSLREYCDKNNIKSIKALLKAFVDVSKKETKNSEEDEMLNRVTSLLIKEEKAINELITQKNTFIKNAKSILLDYFKNNPFQAYSFDALMEHLREEQIVLTDKELSSLLNGLIVKGLIHIKDSKYRYTLFNFDSYLDDLTDKEKAVLKLRLSGLSLEDTGHQLFSGVTRERIRQIQAKAVKKVRHKNFIKCQVPFFIEDYYADFYKKYDCPKELLIKQCGESIFYYLKMMYKKGETKFDYSAASDDIPKIFRRYLAAHMSDYCVNVFGELVPLKKGEIVDAILPHMKGDFSTADLFDAYNNVLAKNGLDSTSKLWAKESSKRTWSNLLASSKLTIDRPGIKFRYYDYESYDFDSFYKEINMSQYNGLVIDTNLLFRENKKLMRRYGIRDKYELHNVMKKTYHKRPKIDFGRMSTLVVGKGDFDLQLYEIIDKYGPINGVELAKIIEKEYGFEPHSFLANVAKRLKDYKNGALYQIDHINMPSERKKMLLNALKEDFYYIEDIQDVYVSLFGKNSVNECTPRNIESLGFKVNQRTAIRKYDSVKDYYEYLMTKDDIFDIRSIPQKVVDSALFGGQKIDLESRYVIIRFDEDKYINIRKLKSAGISVKELKAFAFSVNNFVDDECFNLYTLKKQRFNHPLFDLGFDNVFYSSILKYSGYFSYTAFRADAIFKKKQNENDIDYIDNFYLVQDMLYKHTKIDVDVFIEDINEIYGTVIIKGKWDAVAAAKRAGYYYNDVMNAFYKSKDDYYLDLEEED